ncbi:hypothetical protein JD844_013058 [Phrynosoma platyrhinos]|uniref:Uncharacterized protein n=1 Tax=Phrynosoma platyrhinos TaxID=52577 RepID=A0ABQ7TLJ6_PHRPL|nr:hypothetical protein JD844_013058 [Phrynosoma platyrhinos]
MYGSKFKTSDPLDKLIFTISSTLETQLAIKDEKPMKGIVLSSVSEFSITEVPSKDTKNERKLSECSTSSTLSSLKKCRTQFSYLEDDASVHKRDSNAKKTEEKMEELHLLCCVCS